MTAHPSDRLGARWLSLTQGLPQACRQPRSLISAMEESISSHQFTLACACSCSQQHSALRYQGQVLPESPTPTGQGEKGKWQDPA